MEDASGEPTDSLGLESGEGDGADTNIAAAATPDTSV